MSEPSPSEQRIKNYLKKNININIDEKPSVQSKKEFIKRKLLAEETFEHSYTQQKTFSQRFWHKINLKLLYFQGRGFKTFSTDTLPFLFFIGFSTFIIWKMEEQYDKMVRSVIKVKSYKQQEVEKEDEYIRKALAGEQYDGQKLIKDKNLSKQKYKFEDDDEESEDKEGDFNTKDDLLEAMRKDYNQGQNIPQNYMSDLINYSKRENKLMNQGSKQEESNDKEEEQKDIIYPNLTINNKLKQQNC